MDEKDLIETLTTIGIFAISVALGLISESRKKRKASAKNVKANKRHTTVAKPQRATAPMMARNIEKQLTDTTTSQSMNNSLNRKKAVYSFTAEEEGGCAIGGKHDSPVMENIETPTSPLHDENRKELLRTLILGEILARKF